MTNPDKTTDKPLLKLLGDQKTVEEFKRFRDKENQRKLRKEVEFKVEDILAEELKEENEKAIETLNKVYRKAWTLACKELGYDEAEFPSKY